jgi:hypothetical protein
MPVYPTSIDAIPEARGMIKDTVFPVAARLAQELVTLPTHGYVGEEDIAELRALLQR